MHILKQKPGDSKIETPGFAIIGYEDEKSMGYAQYQYKKFKALTTESMPKAQCDVLRANARDDLAVVKGQYKSGMIEETKADGSKNSDNVATNDNKFFFDIIKWGTALLL